MHAGDSCRPYRAAGQILRFTHHRETQHVNEAVREERGTREGVYGRCTRRHIWALESYRFFFFFTVFFSFFLLFLTGTFPVYFLLFRSKIVCVILNPTATCIHIKLHLVPWF